VRGYGASNPKVGDLWLRKGHRKRANLGQGRIERSMTRAGPRTLSHSVRCNGYKRHTMLPWTRTMGHPPVPRGISYSREEKSVEIGRATYVQTYADDFSTTTAALTTRHVRVPRGNMTSRSREHRLPLSTLRSEKERDRLPPPSRVASLRMMA